VWFLDPAFFVLVMGLLAFWFRSSRWRRVWLVGFLFLSFGVSSVYLAYLASKPLEEYRSYSGTVSCGSFAGVIALGGVIPNEDFNHERGIQLGSSAERVVEPARLYRKCPNFELVFSSFGKELGEDPGESELARELWIDLGVPRESILIENESTNTRENALRTGALLGLKDKWLLVTSASHMKRALSSFEKVGLNVEAVPVDYLFSEPPALWSFSPVEGISLWRTISHEYFGMLYYKLRGWI